MDLQYLAPRQLRAAANPNHWRDLSLERLDENRPQTDRRRPQVGMTKTARSLAAADFVGARVRCNRSIEIRHSARRFGNRDFPPRAKSEHRVRSPDQSETSTGPSRLPVGDCPCD